MARLGRGKVKRINNDSFLVQTGTAALSADSSLTPGGVKVRPAGLAMSSDSSLLPNGTQTQPASPVLNANATLTITGASGSLTLAGHSSLSLTGIGQTTADSFILSADSTLSPSTAESGMLVLASDSTFTIAGIQVAQGLVLMSADSRLTAPGRSGVAQLVGTSYLIATGVAPSRAPLVFLDMSVTVTPPEGHYEPFPLTLGASWQPNDVKLLFVSGQAISASGNVGLDIPMRPDPPPGFTSAYTLDPHDQTHGTYYRRLIPGDLDTSVSWPKPPQWRYFMWANLTARGVNPSVVPVAGKLTTRYHVNNPTATVASVTVPGPGTMLLFLGTFQDPEGNYPSWPSALGVPNGWTPVIATDKSGATYYQYDSNPSVIVIGKNYSSSGTTGAISVPVGSGAPAFFGMYCFLRPAPDVTIAVGAA